MCAREASTLLPAAPWSTMNKVRGGGLLRPRNLAGAFFTLIINCDAEMFRQIGAVAKRHPICVSLSVGTYFTVIGRYLTLFYHTPEISYTPI